MKLHPRHLRISPAMVVAMLALFAALTGTAVATTSALITGKQIKNGSITGADVKNKSLTPRDFRGSVRGPQGPPGPQGAAGALGPQGPAGPKGDQGIQGPAGPFPDGGMPPGKSVYGRVAIAGPPGTANVDATDSISFTYRMSAPLIWHVITGAVPEGCSGTYANPGAAPGHLCVFVHENMHMSPPLIYGNGRCGAMLYANANANGAWAHGTWAATSPIS